MHLRSSTLPVVVALALPLVDSRAESQPAPSPSARDIARSVQNVYDKARTFQASFRQRYWVNAYNKLKASQGRVAFQKPGKMSWRYANSGNRIVSDGKTVRVYEAANKQLFEMPVDKSQYPAALTFLGGGGKLERELVLRKLPAKAMQGGYVIEGVPKAATPAYAKLLLYVDGGTYQVRRVLLLDAQGNRNRFDFDQPKLNRKISPTEFRFTPPAGTKLVRP
jgi:outer membrane lipoprotein carrier protein